MTTAASERAPRCGAQSENAPAKPLPELHRLASLEADNARLLRLVGELLVVNQQLREQNAAQNPQIRSHGAAEA